jgi:UTP--glucose-1-phosphate uridylyltransferase
VGRYILTPEVFDMFEQVTPGAIGEIQLTDALRLLRESQRIYAYEFDGVRHDTGEPLGFLRASIEYAMARTDVGPGLREYLRQLDLGG